MAERRMFAKTIVLSDEFLDMPLSTRCLYFTLGMLADDDGFINKPNTILRMCGASVDDMNILLMKKFILQFENGIIVIKHWRLNNYLRNDRYHETTYKELKGQLSLDSNGSYTLKNTGIPVGIPSLVKSSLGKDIDDVMPAEIDKELNKYASRFIEANYSMKTIEKTNKLIKSIQFSEINEDLYAYAIGITENNEIVNKQAYLIKVAQEKGWIKI